MNLPSETFGDVVVVHTPEEMTTEQAERLEQWLVSLDRRNVVVDLDNTEMIDSPGLTALLDARDNLRTLEGDLKVATTSVTNRKILEITRLDAELEVYDSVIDAVRSFR